MNKILSSLFTISILTLLIACSEDKENEIATSAELTSGIWKFESADFNITVNGKSFKEFYMESFDATEEEAEEAMKTWDAIDIKYGATVEFKSDNKYEMKVPDEDTEIGTWLLSDDGKKLTIDAIPYEISSFSSNRMSLFFAVSSQVDLNNDGILDNFKNETITHLKK